MEVIEVLRKQMRALAGQALGLSARQPRIHGAQQYARGLEQEILNLPVDGDNWVSLIDTDPDSTSFSERFFIADYDQPDLAGPVV